MMCAQGAASGGVPSGCNMVGFAHNCRSLYELWCRENSSCRLLRFSKVVLTANVNVWPKPGDKSVRGSVKIKFLKEGAVVTVKGTKTLQKSLADPATVTYIEISPKGWINAKDVKEATPSIAKFVKGFCKGKCLQVSHHWARGSINPLRLTARFDGVLDAE